MNQNNLSYAINIEDNLCTAGLGIGLVGFGSGRFRVNKIGFWIFPSWNGFNKNFRYFLIFLYIPLDLDFDIFYTISGNLTKDNLTIDNLTNLNLTPYKFDEKYNLAKKMDNKYNLTKYLKLYKNILLSRIFRYKYL